jgi:hypothetical protein
MHSSFVVRETEGDCSGQRRRSEDIKVGIAPPYIRFLRGLRLTVNGRWLAERLHKVFT